MGTAVGLASTAHPTNNIIETMIAAEFSTPLVRFIGNLMVLKREPNNCIIRLPTCLSGTHPDRSLPINASGISPSVIDA